MTKVRVMVGFWVKSVGSIWLPLELVSTFNVMVRLILRVRVMVKSW